MLTKGFLQPRSPDLGLADASAAQDNVLRFRCPKPVQPGTLVKLLELT
jgi:hypothetical protein